MTDVIVRVCVCSHALSDNLVEVMLSDAESDGEPLRLLYSDSGTGLHRSSSFPGAGHHLSAEHTGIVRHRTSHSVKEVESP